MKSTKIRVNITVDEETLKKAKTKLHLFGGKLSTLFNAYLSDFVESMDKDYAANQKGIVERLTALEKKLDKLDKKKLV